MKPSKAFTHGAMVFFTIALFILPAESASALPCGKDQYFVKGHPRKSYVRADGTRVRATQVKDYCKEKSPGFFFLEGKLKNFLPEDWPIKEKGKKWEEAEKILLIEALDAIPAGLFPKKLLGFYRAEKSRDFPNPATHGNVKKKEEGYIVIYDNAFSHKSEFARILAHEMSHQIYVEMSEEEKESYQVPMGWMKALKPDEFVSRMEDFLRDDSRGSPEEDFANNVEFFLYEPKILKKKLPHAHRWILEHFGDKFKLNLP